MDTYCRAETDLVEARLNQASGVVTSQPYLREYSTFDCGNAHEILWVWISYSMPENFVA